MALDLDVSRSLRGIDGRRDLVRAIVGAHSSDESEWLEWKSDLDLTAKSGCFAVAKAILGMANRPVDVAARTCGGHGYVAVGVEPENLAGVEMPDPSQWIERVEVYLKGETGPFWEWTIVPVDDKHVLVITVYPSEHGDPPWPLRKELNAYRSGTLFVRKSGKTEPALAEDVDQLGRRMLADGGQLPQLLVEVVGDVPVPWLAGAQSSENVAMWVQRERDRRLAAAVAVEDERNETRNSLEAADWLDHADDKLTVGQVNWQKVVAGMQNTIRVDRFAQFQDEPDERTLAEYTAELDEWATKLARPALNDLARRICDAGHGLVYLRVSNNSTQYLPGVEVRLQIAFELAEGFVEVPNGDDLPDAPRPYGKANPGPLNHDWFLAGMPLPTIPNLVDFRPDYSRDTSIENGSIKVTHSVGELRPKAVHEGDDFYIFLPTRPPDGVLRATWTATVQNRDGIIEGHLTIPVQEDPIDICDLLPNRTATGADG